MCKDIHLDANEFSLLVTELPATYVRLHRNQWMRGWTIVALKRHASELFELTHEELSQFWSDVSRVAKAMDRIYRPVKLNYLVMGHLCPHIHCHLLVHSSEDDPHKPINMGEQEILLDEEEYSSMIHELRRAINAV